MPGPSGAPRGHAARSCGWRRAADGVEIKARQDSSRLSVVAHCGPRGAERSGFGVLEREGKIKGLLAARANSLIGQVWWR